MPSVVITGVSTGIGHAAAQVLVAKGFHVFGSVRKAADAERLQSECGDNFTPLLFDVTDQAAVEQAAAQVAEALGDENLAGLVNNAGIAVPGPLVELPVDQFRHQLEVNLVGTFIVTQAFAPLLGVSPDRLGQPGRIINISSMAGVRALPFVGPYSASKFGMEGYSESLRRELLLYGVDVIIIGPGPVQTPIWDKAGDEDTSAYKDSPYLDILTRFSRAFIEEGRNGYPAELLGDLIHHALTTPKPKVRYPAVKGRALEKLLMRLVSKRTVDRLVGKRLGLLPPLDQR